VCPGATRGRRIVFFFLDPRALSIHPSTQHSSAPRHLSIHLLSPQKVYYVAKQMAHPCSPEDFGLALARHFLKHHPLVSRAKVRVTLSPWVRAATPAGPHAHGYEGGGGGNRFAVVLLGRNAPAATVIGGVKGWRVLKTTQSGYAGFTKDAWTALPDVGDRILATSVSASWRYSRPVAYDGAYAAVIAAMAAAFFGPAGAGSFSPSAQFTLHEMGSAALASVPGIDSIALTLPNLHFLPCAPLGDWRGFEDDVYVATAEPHGVIEASMVREGVRAPHVELWGEDGLGPAARL